MDRRLCALSDPGSRDFSTETAAGNLELFVV
jgi:hypothetical protein